MHIWCAPTWRFHTELCKFLRNISTNICGLGERTDIKLGEVFSLFIFNRITISWLYPLNGFWFIFYCVTVKTIYCFSLLFWVVLAYQVTLLNDLVYFDWWFRTFYEVRLGLQSNLFCPGSILFDCRKTITEQTDRTGQITWKINSRKEIFEIFGIPLDVVHLNAILINFRVLSCGST